jgi:hypothetical protein
VSAPSPAGPTGSPSSGVADETVGRGGNSCSDDQLKGTSVAAKRARRPVNSRADGVETSGLFLLPPDLQSNRVALRDLGTGGSSGMVVPPSSDRVGWAIGPNVAGERKTPPGRGRPGGV